MIAVDARKQAAPNANTESCLRDRADVMGVLSYMTSGADEGDDEDGGEAGAGLAGAGNEPAIVGGDLGPSAMFPCKRTAFRVRIRSSGSRVVSRICRVGFPNLGAPQDYYRDCGG